MLPFSVVVERVSVWTRGPKQPQGLSHVTTGRRRPGGFHFVVEGLDYYLPVTRVLAPCEGHEGPLEPLVAVVLQRASAIAGEGSGQLPGPPVHVQVDARLYASSSTKRSMILLMSP